MDNSCKAQPSGGPSSVRSPKPGSAPRTLGYVAAHGISTPVEDHIEAEAIRETLGDVPVTAPKSYFGHLGPAAGSLEAIVSVLAFQHGVVPPTLNYEEPDPRCPIQVIHGQPMPLDRPTALISQYTRHGQAVAVVLEGATTGEPWPLAAESS